MTAENRTLVAGARTPLARLRTTDWLLLACLAAAFAPGIVALSVVWDRFDYYSHGYLVPLVAFWAATAQRHRLPQLPARRDSRGLLLVGVAIGVYLVGLLSGVLLLVGAGLIAGVAGAVLHLRGTAWLSALSFPIGYLIFMVPLPESLITPLIVALQGFVSSAAVALLRLAGYSLMRLGNVLELPGGETLFVAEACSGITSLITLVPLGVFLAYFTERTLARRTILVLSVVPVAMFGNLVRVVGTVVLAERVGVEAATDSALHDWVGVGTYLLACAVLLGVGRLMRVSESDRSASEVPA